MANAQYKILKLKDFGCGHARCTICQKIIGEFGYTTGDYEPRPHTYVCSDIKCMDKFIKKLTLERLE